MGQKRTGITMMNTVKATVTKCVPAVVQYGDIIYEWVVYLEANETGNEYMFPAPYKLATGKEYQVDTTDGNSVPLDKRLIL